MASHKQLESITAGFNSLQSQLEQQLLRSQEIQNELDSLSNDKHWLNNDHIHDNETEDYKLQSVASLKANTVTNYFTNNIMSSITSNNKAMNRFTDVVFEVCDDQHNDTVHFYGIRALFAMHSNVFEKMLYPLNTNNKNILIQDKYIIPSIFEIITHLCYGLSDIDACVSNKNAMYLLYAANKYNMKALTDFCIDFIVNMIYSKQRITMNVLCDILNEAMEMNLNDIFDEIIQRTIVAQSIAFNQLLSLNNEYLVKYLSFDAVNKLLFESVLKNNLSSELQWTFCLKWSKHRDLNNYKNLLKQFKDKMDFTSMSGAFFVKYVQSHDILNENELVLIMEQYLNKDENDNKNEDVLQGLNLYNASFSKVLVYNKRAEIVTNGFGECQWIWFGNNNGWESGKHIFKVRCDGLSQHESGNIVGIIGTTNYELIKNIWNKNECVYDVYFDDEEVDGEVVSMSYDWNGCLYKNNEMIQNTQNPWGLCDEISVIIDIEKQDLKFLKNGKSVTDLEIVAANHLMWFPLLQCCACKGHRYSAYIH